MEQKVNLYLGVSGGIASGNIRRGWCCVLEVKGAAGDTTREGFGEVVGTHRLATLIALSHALGRFCRPCEIHVHSEDGWVLAMLDKRLGKWAQCDYKDSKGNEIDHRAEWEAVHKLAKGHLLVPEPGRHSYSSWMESEFKRRKLGEESGDVNVRINLGECEITEQYEIEYGQEALENTIGETIAAPAAVQQYQEGEEDGNNT